MINKKFNMWIANNFKGLSACTLCQFLQLEMGYFKKDADNTVYVDLYAVFCNKATMTQNNLFEVIYVIVDDCAWL